MSTTRPVRYTNTRELYTQFINRTPIKYTVSITSSNRSKDNVDIGVDHKDKVEYNTVVDDGNGLAIP